MQQTCYACGRAIARPRTTKAGAPRRLTSIERAELARTDPDAYRRWAATIGPLEDLEFHVRLYPGDAAALALAAELETRPATAADRAAIARIKAATAPHPGALAAVYAAIDAAVAAETAARMAAAAERMRGAA